MSDGRSCHDARLGIRSAVRLWCTYVVEVGVNLAVTVGELLRIPQSVPQW